MNDASPEVQAPAGSEVLGSEFLLWLWYRSEASFGRLRGASGTAVDLWVDDRLLLRRVEGGNQRFDLRGGAPATSATARTAMLEGRGVAAARFGLRHGELEYGFELHADLSLRGVALPDTGAATDDHEVVLERARLLQELLGHLDDLYEEFCGERLDEDWEHTVATTMRTWLRDDVIDDEGAPEADPAP